MFGFYELPLCAEPTIWMTGLSSLISSGASMSLSESPESQQPLWHVFGRPVVLICDHCSRVRVASDGDSDEQWQDRVTYLAKQGLTPPDVWYWRMTCRECAQFRDRPGG
jgi:hypothetical protein